MKKWTCCLSIFALFLSSAGAQEKKVEVDQTYEYIEDSKGELKIKTLPYLKRRPTWGIRLNFATSFIELKREAVTKKDGTPFQLDIGFNRRFSFFSVGPELGLTSAKFKNTASIKGFSLGAGLYLDGLSSTTYVVPFASIGVISLSGDVDEPNPSGSGEMIKADIDTKAASLYYRVGLLIGLNWIDKSAAQRGLLDYGLQNSFIYVAMRKIGSTAKAEGFFDLETTFYMEYGLQLEF